MIPALAKAISVAAPRADATSWASALGPPMAGAGITTLPQIAMFISQCAVESEGFTKLSEDLWYTSAARIREVWPEHFATVADAVQFIGEPEALANFVYANRMGNGPSSSGDGWRYRGRGLIQVTGKAQYQMIARHDARATDPDWLATEPGAAISACCWWSWHLAGQLSLLALSDRSDVREVTLRVNGSLDSLAPRETLFHAVMGALSPTAVVPPVVMASETPGEITADKLMQEYD